MGALDLKDLHLSGDLDVDLDIDPMTCLGARFHGGEQGREAFLLTVRGRSAELREGPQE